MHTLLLLLLAAGPARADDPRLARKTSRLDAQAAEVLAPCATAPDELACLEAALPALAAPTVRHRGQDVAVQLPSVDQALARRHALRVSAAVEGWRGGLAEAWRALERPEQPDEALAVLDGYLAAWDRDVLEVDGEEVAVEDELLATAHALRLQADLALRTTVVASELWQGGVRTRVEVPDAPAPRLRRLSSTKNQVIDDDAWFREHDLVLPERRVAGGGGDWPRRGDPLPATTPDQLGGRPLSRVLLDGDQLVAVYGDLYVQGEDRIPPTLAVLAADGTVQRAWDLAAWQRAPGVVAGDEPFVEQELRWARVRDGRLYLSTAHRTYAASSKGHTGYLAAFDVESGDLLWRSPPLVANAVDFALTEAHAITGYGFTAEPDYLYVVSLADGRVVRRVPVPSGPDFLFLDGDRLLVRTYDHDMVFAVE